MDATLEKHGRLFTLTVERRLAHPIEKVWRVVTEDRLLNQWFPCDVVGDWIVGAELRFNFRNGEEQGLPEEYLYGKVLAVDEPRLLEYTWGSHVMKYELAPDGDGCVLRLSESFDDASWGARNAAGWEMCLDTLQLVLDGAELVKFAADVWKTKFKHYARQFEPHFGHQHDPSDEHPLLKE